MDNNNTTTNNSNHKRFHFDLLFPFLLRPRATAPKIAQKRGTWLTPLLIVTLLIIARVLLATPATVSTVPVEATPESGIGPQGMEGDVALVSANQGGGGGGGGGEEPPLPEGEMPLELAKPSIGSLLLPALGAVASLWVGWFLFSVLL